MEIKTIVLMCIITASLLVIPASQAYLSYTPQWNKRLNATIGSEVYPLDALYSVTFDSSHAYYLGIFTGTNSSGGATTNSSLIILSYNGDVLNSYIYYYPSGNLTSLDALYAWGNVYITGYLSDQYGVYGTVYMVNSSDGEVVNGYSDTDTSYTVMRGVCRDGLGHVYTVGFQYSSRGSPKINATVFEFDSSLNLIARNEFYVSGFNMTGWDCVVGPDGALYVSTTLYYYTGGYNFPAYFLLMKLDQTLGIIDYTYYPLYNSQYYVTLAANRWIPLSTDNNLVYAAYTWSDDKPSPDNPSTRASVIAVDTSLNIAWNYTLSTDAYEFFDALTVGSDGSLIVAGGTNNNYTTPLSSNYYHGFALIFDSSHSVEKAILFGGSNGEIVLGTGIDGSGGVYLASVSNSNDVSFYDVTSEVLSARSNSGVAAVELLQPAKPAALPKELAGNIRLHTITSGYSEYSSKYPSISRVTVRSAKIRAIALEATSTGLSSGLAVKLAETLSPPPSPVPESLLVPITVAASLLLALFLTWRRGFLPI